MNVLYNVFSVLVVLQFSIRLGLGRQSIFRWLWGLLLAISVWILLPYAWDSSMLELNQRLREGTWANNFVLLVSLDVLAGLGIILRLYKNHFMGIRKFEWLVFLPSILILPSVFWLGAQFFFYFPEYNYMVTAWILSITVVLLIPLLSLFFRWILLDRIAYLEFGVLLNILLFVLMLILPLVKATGIQYRQPVRWISLATFLILVFTGFIIGVICRIVYKKN